VGCGNVLLSDAVKDVHLAVSERFYHPRSPGRGGPLHSLGSVLCQRVASRGSPSNLLASPLGLKVARRSGCGAIAAHGWYLA
jgi:hypothetical protein